MVPNCQCELKIAGVAAVAAELIDCSLDRGRVTWSYLVQNFVRVVLGPIFRYKE